ncbi:MAG TPA: aminodeoxychorismate synthase component I [Pyrinomonadaceae bacterium]|jgi:para-aminobenzoate synthetase/4-amino-4-deoxychorismate lyase|nr:aminodeoxychorismate synthase component I [Pyrinomonadaceae bacterium]
MRDTPVVILDFAEGPTAPGRTRFERPAEVVAARTIEEVRPALRRVERAAAGGMYAAGFVAYEAAPAFDSSLVVRAGGDVPLLWFGLFDGPAGAGPVSGGEFEVTGWEPSVSRREYARRVGEARELIASGYTYQVNYTLRLRARLRGDDFAFYERLLAAQRTRYGAYVNAGRFRVLSASPELFFEREGQAVRTRPMKGTARRGRWLEEDEGAAARLAASAKDRAENVMIVDLLRNDLGRVSEFGSVRAAPLFEVERYPTVFQMTSTVGATLREGTTLEDIFAALFPCGSVTGAPKVSTTRIIAGLEDSPRGVYCGAVGVVAPGGDALFNVGIRTAVVDGASGAVEYGTGGGVTWDSNAADEYAEALDKARLLSEGGTDFELLETMRLEGGQYALLEEHLERLASSAKYFDFRLSETEIRAALAGHAAQHPSGARRVRLLVARDGRARVESGPLGEARREGPAHVALAGRPVSRLDRFLYHKTTRREVYEARRAEHPGAFDVLLRNEEGELTEFTNGNLVVELEGRRWTPPRECGLLAGTFRARLLRAGEAEERVLTPADLRRASRCWFVNSVRGWVEVQFVW